MVTKEKFFGIYKNSYNFKELTEKEQKEFLIKKSIYIKGISNEVYDGNLVNPYYLRSENIQFLGKDFNLKNVNYTLNPQFINEVYNAMMENFESKKLILINDHINALKLSLNLIKDNEEKSIFLKETQKKAIEDYQKQLSNKIFQDFHIQKGLDKNYKENVIKKHLKYDIKYLSDYIFGLDNVANFLSITEYFSFNRTSQILKFCNKNIPKLEHKTNILETKGLDTTQKILVIEKLIKFANKWETTDERKKAYIISKIIDRNEDNIRKTLAKSDKKPSEYTKKFIKDIEVADEIINKLG